MLEVHLEGQMEWSWKADEGENRVKEGRGGEVAGGGVGCGERQGEWPDDHENEWKSAMDRN